MSCGIHISGWVFLVCFDECEGKILTRQGFVCADDFLAQHIVKFNQIMRDLAAPPPEQPPAAVPSTRGVPAY